MSEASRQPARQGLPCPEKLTIHEHDYKGVAEAIEQGLRGCERRVLEHLELDAEIGTRRDIGAGLLASLKGMDQRILVLLDIGVVPVSEKQDPERRTRAHRADPGRKRDAKRRDGSPLGYAVPVEGTRPEEKALQTGGEPSVPNERV
ncbi:hypothetical protein [Methylorubrum extorquens]|uniref:hypothetical protein n=1 Tax=Methylorubrum extorquens TaxID=408 RepID=UPI00130196C4|nr:hypothetical protein [Methylorubrum extorquens]